MHYIYKTKGTCSTKIEFDFANDKILNVVFTGGCNGNLKAISKLVEGLTPEEIIKKCNRIECGQKKTSCADQLAQAMKQIEK